MSTKKPTSKPTSDNPTFIGTVAKTTKAPKSAKGSAESRPKARAGAPPLTPQSGDATMCDKEATAGITTLAKPKLKPGTRTASPTGRGGCNSIPWWVTDLPAFEPEGFEPDQTYWDLFSEVEWLHELVMWNCEPDTDIAKLFLLAYPEGDSKTQRCASVRGLTAALEAFHALPEAQRREILDGWNWSADDRMSRSERQAEFNDECVRPARIIESGCRTTITGFRYIDAASSAHVRLAIAVGMSQAYVLGALERFTSEVRENWSRIIASDGGGAK